MSQPLTEILNDPAVLALFDAEEARINRAYQEGLAIWTEALIQTSKKETQ